MKDFFISYNGKDKAWAEWIAYQLEAAGYTTVIQAWDFRPGGNFVVEMQTAATNTERTIAVLSPNYLAAEYTQPEWAAAFANDPQGKDRILVPVRIAPCELTGLHKPIIHIDLVGQDESTAIKSLINGVKTERAKPQQSPAFPGQPTPQPPTTRPKPAFPGARGEKPWNIPHDRNPFFTGREDVLKKLYEALTSGSAAALSQPQALSGLGGIGKTQTAVEYAYRYRDEYTAVLWTRAESREALASSFVALAQVLDLPAKNEQDQNVVIAAVRRWLEQHTGWLLILDNADEIPLVREFLPSAGTGQGLLTTRAQALGPVAQRIEIDEMPPAEGAQFLLQRAAYKTPTDTDCRLAEQISTLLGGLPLALDQAGAFIEETPSSLAEYLELYQKEGARLLAERGELAPDHASVTVTFALAFEQVAARDPAAADLLRLCAFLAPDAIPEEIFTEGADALG